MRFSMPPIGWIVAWAGLVAWWLVLLRFRRGRPWLRSPALAAGLVIATLFADASVIVASMRMGVQDGREFAALVLWIAAFFSVTTFAILRTPPADGGSGGDGGSPTGGEPEPPWWPDFERDFRDYARRRSDRPKTPAGTR